MTVRDGVLGAYIPRLVSSILADFDIEVVYSASYDGITR